MADARHVIENSHYLDLSGDELSTEIYLEASGTCAIQFVSAESKKAFTVKLPFATIRRIHQKLDPFCK